MATASQPLTKTPFELDAAVLGFFRREFAHTPGRINSAARAAVSASIMVLIGEASRSHELFVAVFVPLLIPRDTPQQTWAATKGIITIAWTACIVSIVLLLATIDLPGARVLALTAAIFVCMILSRGLHKPPIAALGPVIATLTLVQPDNIFNAEHAVTTGMWVALMMSSGCLVATAVDFLFPHPGPRQNITAGIVKHLQAAAAVLKKCSGADLSREEQQALQSQGTLALAGTGSLRKLLPALSTQLSVDTAYVQRLSAVLHGLDLLSDQAVQLSSQGASYFSEEQKESAGELSQGTMALAEAIQHSSTASRDRNQALDSSGDAIGDRGPGQLLADMGLQLQDLWGVWCSQITPSNHATDTANAKPAEASPKPGPFVTPDDFRFAIKVTLASMICYLVYNGVSWQGISTSVLTCFLTADSTIGGTFRKLTLRLSGVLVGGLLFGMGGIALVLSHMDNVVELLLYIAVVFFTAGWITKGSPKVSYAGSQIGISFGLVALFTSVIPDQIVEARDRLVGVLLGTIVMWFVFTRIWPIDTQAQQKHTIAGLIRKASELILLAVDDSSTEIRSAKATELRASINQGLTQAGDQADLSIYESKSKSAQQSALRKCLASTRNLLTLELAQVGLSIRSAHEADPRDPGRKAERTTAKSLCAIAERMEKGELPPGAQEEDEHADQSPQHRTVSDSGDTEHNTSEPHQAVVAANMHIRKRRRDLIEDLSQAVENVTLSTR